MKLSTSLLGPLMIALGFATPVHAAESEAKASVTIPVERFLELRKLEEATELTVIEDVTFSGTYGKNLQISVSGSSNGKPQAVQFLDQSSEFNLHDCSGNALLHSSNSRLAILPQSSRFKLSCQIDVKSWSQIDFVVWNSLYVRSKVEGGEAIQDGNDSQHRLTLTKIDRGGGGDEKAEVAAIARYRVSIQPEESRFEYTLTLSNPSRNKRRFQISLPNGEIPQSVKTSTEYVEAQGSIEVTLVPGENRVWVGGRYSALGFTPPLKTAQSFFLVETHPMLQASIESAARRVSPQDAGIAAHFPAARAYLIGGNDSVSWKTKKLETFSTLGYSVTDAKYLFYVPRSGQSLVEARFMFNNQGMPEIPLEVPGRATYMEIGGQPQVLSKDDKGRLLLQLPTGQQSVMIQYETKAEVGGLLASASELLARPTSVLSNVGVSFAIDDRWQVLGGQSLGGFKSDWSFRDFLYAAIVLAACLAIFARAGIVGTARWFMAVGIGAFALLIPEVITWVVSLVIVGAIVRHRVWFYDRRPTTWKAWIATGVVGFIGFLVFVNVVSPSLQNYAPQRNYEGVLSQKMGAVTSNAIQGYANSSGGGGGGNFGAAMPKSRAMEEDLAMDESAAPPPPMAPVPGEPTAEGSVSGTGEFQGLPARIAIPTDVRQLSYFQGLMDEKTNPRLSFFMISKSLVGFVMLFLAAIVGWFGYRNWRRWTTYLRLDGGPSPKEKPRAVA